MKLFYSAIDSALITKMSVCESFPFAKRMLNSVCTNGQ